MIDHDDAVAIAVIRNPQIGFFCEHAGLQRTNVGCTDLFINVQAIRFAADRNDFGTQFAKYIRCDVVGRAIGTIDHNFQMAQTQLVRERAFTEFNITACSIDNAAGFT
ncbi:hypothetical protein D3C76_1515310 [compost metagenome]